MPYVKQARRERQAPFVQKLTSSIYITKIICLSVRVSHPVYLKPHDLSSWNFVWWSTRHMKDLEKIFGKLTIFFFKIFSKFFRKIFFAPKILRRLNFSTISFREFFLPSACQVFALMLAFLTASSVAFAVLQVAVLGAAVLSISTDITITLCYYNDHYAITINVNIMR